MNVEARGLEAAQGLRSRTTVDVEAGLSRLRHTRRRREIARVIAACAMVAVAAGGVVVATDGRTEVVSPAEEPGLRNGPIIPAGEREFGPAPILPSQAPYPLWQAADPNSGSFLYAAESGSVVVVDATGIVAELDCRCQLGPYPSEAAFGPDSAELTFADPHEFAGLPQTLRVVGYDGEVRDEIRLEDTGIPDGELKHVAWSPDGSQLAVAVEAEPTGEVWVLARDSGRARLVHREKAPRALVEGRYVNAPVLVDLAWSPDGSRLGIIAAPSFQGEDGQPADPSHPRPRLVVVPAEGGEEQALHTFDFRGSHSTVAGNYIRNWAFAWSPDGRRVAVTSKGGIAEISSSSGTVLAEHPGADVFGPLAWLAR